MACCVAVGDGVLAGPGQAEVLRVSASGSAGVNDLTEVRASVRARRCLSLVAMETSCQIRLGVPQDEVSMC